MESLAGAYTAGGPVRLWLPGLGVTDPRVRRVSKAVEQYDAAFRLARHEVTGDWVVVIGDKGHPVFGFGRELPHPDDVERILGKHDIARHGPRIMADLAREAEKVRLDKQYRISESDGIVAEHLEHGFRREHKHPTTRIFVPRSLSGR